MSKTFFCECCRQTLPQTNSDAEAEAEARALFGADFDLEQKAVVCDECFEKMGRYFAE